MRILICSKFFYPSDKIGAVRPSNFAKYLAQLGHQVTVITEENSSNLKFDLSKVQIIRTSNSTWIKKIINRNKVRLQTSKPDSPLSQSQSKTSRTGQISTKFEPKVPKVRTKSVMFSLLIEYDYYRIAKRHILKQFNLDSFDIVISSYGPLSSFLIGRTIKKRGIAPKWLCDFRDNMVFNGYPYWLNKLFSSYEKSAVKFANAITFVSQGQKNMFINNNNVGDLHKTKIHTIYNGFEKELMSISPVEKENDILTFTYTGQLYSGVRDFRLLLHALDDLIKEKLVNKDQIKIIYAGSSSDVLRQQLAGFDNIISSCIDYGMVSREVALRIQTESDILIVLTWNTKKEQGILTGKFFEYLQAEKPIISITSGDLANGELTDIISRANLGIACECITYKDDLLKLKNYILKQYQLMIKSENLAYCPNFEQMKKFHYGTITDNFEKIILSL